MNKKEIGKYLEKLRNKIEFSRTDVARAIGTTFKSILDWEKGVMPSDSRMLLELANLYGVTIDDILECGKQITYEELIEKYPLFKPFDKDEIVDGKTDLYTPYQRNLLNTNKRLKELIILFRRRSLSRSEDYELRFLFEKMCSFSDYYIEEHTLKKDRYLCFIDLLKSTVRDTKTNSEYYFEVRKNIRINTRLHNPFPRYGDPKEDSIKDEQFKSLENWEKDSYLALIQNNDLIDDPSFNINYLNYYKQALGEDFDKEKAVKRLIRYFIDNGAMLNSYYFSFIEKRKIKSDVLTKLEDIYLDYLKPIFIQYYNRDGQEKYAFVQNNENNRFLDNYYDYYYALGHKYECDPKELQTIFINNNEEEITNYFCNKYQIPEIGINGITSKGQVNHYLHRYREHHDKYINNTDLAKKDLNQLKNLEDKLNKKEKYFYDYELKDISKESDFNHLDLIEMWRTGITYHEYLKYRDEQMTKELLDDLDKISLDEIRSKYFPKEEVEIDD